MIKKAAAALVVLFGAAWPFLMHSLAMHRLYLTLSRDPRWWFFYGVFVVILPCPAILYAGFMVFLKDQMPFPANAVVAGAASSTVMVVVSILFYLVVGAVGFQVPL